MHQQYQWRIWLAKASKLNNGWLMKAAKWPASVMTSAAGEGGGWRYQHQLIG
jgi:hypothetical protein